jgi:hypothetical protein
MPLPAPLPPWAKALTYLAPFAYAAGEAAFDYLDEHDDAAQMVWGHVTYHFWRSTPAATTEDRAQISFDVVKYSGGDIDSSWNAAQFTPVLAQLDEVVTAWATSMDNNAACQEARCYARRFNSSGTAFEPMGDPILVVPKSIVGAGTATNVMPYQVACSVTEKTALRKNWGRFYLPNPSVGIMDGYGRFTQASIAALATAIALRYVALHDAGYYVVVPSITGRGLFTVTAIQIDDVPDVIRRRRPRQTLVRELRPVA